MKFIPSHLVQTLDGKRFRVVIQMKMQALSSGFDGARFFDAKQAQNFTQVAVWNASKAGGRKIPIRENEVLNEPSAQGFHRP